MCSLTGHAQTLMKTVTQQLFQNKQALMRALHNCSAECKTRCTIGDLLSPVMQPGNMFSCVQRSLAAVFDFARRKKNGKRSPLERTGSPSLLPRAVLLALSHSIGFKFHGCTCCGRGEARTPPRAPLPNFSVSVYKNRPDKHGQF